jgi:hypothetical protein
MIESGAWAPGSGLVVAPPSYCRSMPFSMISGNEARPWWFVASRAWTYH